MFQKGRSRGMSVKNGRKVLQWELPMWIRSQAMMIPYEEEVEQSVKMNRENLRKIMVMIFSLQFSGSNRAS
ncbi:hypothetical protein HOLleu_13848 [Holothuria leucospilota]|uniref:Uncharacterized protein n=1 Tax=Holothuria leucospilota TaxID=206669 RepID=A0A9Q1H8J5_HOLLE|nr:hypothetical protein HOLleu_13848 [Holothuria leucospilota]